MVYVQIFFDKQGQRSKREREKEKERPLLFSRLVSITLHRPPFIHQQEPILHSRLKLLALQPWPRTSRQAWGRERFRNSRGSLCWEAPSLADWGLFFLSDSLWPEGSRTSCLGLKQTKHSPCTCELVSMILGLCLNCVPVTTVFHNSFYHVALFFSKLG